MEEHALVASRKDVCLEIFVFFFCFVLFFFFFFFTDCAMVEARGSEKWSCKKIVIDRDTTEGKY